MIIVISIQNDICVRIMDKNLGHLLNIYKCEYCQIDEQEYGQ